MKSWQSKTATWEKATPEQRMIWLAGVNPRYWDASFKQLKPDSFTTERRHGRAVTVTAAMQQKIIDDLVAEPKRMNKRSRIGVGSEPSESLGMIFAHSVIKLAVNAGIPVGIIDLGNIPNKRDSAQEMDRWARIMESQVVVVHNVTTESTPDRIQVARDWLKRFGGKFCVFVVAGSDPISFADNKLRLPIDACFKFDGHRKVKVREV